VADHRWTLEGDKLLGMKFEGYEDSSNWKLDFT